MATAEGSPCLVPAPPPLSSSRTLIIVIVINWSGMRAITSSEFAIKFRCGIFVMIKVDLLRFCFV